MKGNPIRHIDHQTCQETIPDIPPDFSFRAFSSRPHTYPDGNFPWHWHRELEWFYVTDGELSCHLAQGIFVFRTGEGGFFNTNVLHKISCPVGTVCVHEVLQFPAEFVAPPGSRIQENYVFPIVENTELPIFKFDPQVPAHWPALDLLRKAYSVFRARLPGYEMDVQALVLQLWKELFFLAADSSQTRPALAEYDRLRKMLSYIADHFAEPVRLEDIAAASSLSPRACERCFRNQLDTAPLVYLMNYRLHHACDLLTGTDLPIKQIAKDCGFNSNSYFTRLFTARTGVTPQSYRRAHSVR